MAEVLRLLRFSLMLRVAIAVVFAIIAIASGNAGAAVAVVGTTGNFVPLALLTGMGSLVLLGVTSYVLAKNKVDARTVNRLLAATIIVQTVEAAVAGAIFQGPERGLRIGLPRTRGEPPTIDSLLIRGALGSVIFAAIPTMLGAWLGGRRRAFAWAAFAVLTSLGADLLVIAPNWNALRFVFSSALSQAVGIAVLAYFVGSLADQLRNDHAQLESANRQLAEQGRVREQLATSRERVRLSRDLHDTLAHTLAGLIVQMNAIATLLDRNPAAAKSELSKAQTAAKTGLADTRAAIGDLRANVVEDLGLSGALKRQAELTEQRTSAQVTFEQSGPEPTLANEAAETLYRITQEALHNVERHANARHIRVELCNGPALTLTVKDDGIGFDVTALDDDRFGIRGMRERAELIGAHLRIDSVPAQGTTVTVTLKPEEIRDKR